MDTIPTNDIQTRHRGIYGPNHPQQMRYDKRTDDNHRDVVDELRKAMPQATVFDASGAGKGFPDLVIGYCGHNFLFEIKDPAKPASKRDLTDAQRKLHDSWQGQIDIAHSAAEICAKIAYFFHLQCSHEHI